jgi:CRISPR system Cascade subunit CasE
LQQAAQSFALPEVSAVCDWRRLESKALPGEWRAGQRLGFDVRLRPVGRLASPLPSSGGSFARGAELDAFLIEALRRFPQAGDSEASMAQSGRTRQAVYAEWFAARLKGAASLEPAVVLKHFQRRRAVRTAASPEGPDATLQGTLVVQDPPAFQQLLAGGVGRHKAYGFGMILLRPPGRV